MPDSEYFSETPDLKLLKLANAAKTFAILKTKNFSFNFYPKFHIYWKFHCINFLN